MSQKIVTRTTGLVDYKELETNILSSIREGRPLTGRDGALTPFIKRLLEASLEGCDPKVVILWWLNSIFPKHQG